MRNYFSVTFWNDQVSINHTSECHPVGQPHYITNVKVRLNCAYKPSPRKLITREDKGKIYKIHKHLLFPWKGTYYFTQKIVIMNTFQKENKFWLREIRRLFMEDKLNVFYESLNFGMKVVNARSEDQAKICKGHGLQDHCKLGKSID